MIGHLNFCQVGIVGMDLIRRGKATMDARTNNTDDILYATISLECGFEYNHFNHESQIFGTVDEVEEEAQKEAQEMLQMMLPRTKSHWNSESFVKVNLSIYDCEDYSSGTSAFKCLADHDIYDDKYIIEETNDNDEEAFLRDVFADLQSVVSEIVERVTKVRTALKE